MGVNDLTKLELSVGRWGNSLAVRLPAELARELDLREGDRIQAEVTTQGELRMLVPHLSTADKTSRERMVAELRRVHATLPLSRPVTRDELSRY